MKRSGISYLGRWAGTARSDLSSTGSFNSYTEIEVSERNGELYLRRYDRKSAKALEGRMKWFSDLQFEGQIGHWILTTHVTVSGMFHQHQGGLRLLVSFEGDGMTGLEKLEVDMTQELSIYKHYQTAIQETAKQPEDDFQPHVDSKELVPNKALSKQQTLDIIRSMTTSCGSATVPDVRVEAIMLMQNGKALLEEYFWGMNRETQHIISSSTKSITAILAGIAWDQGFFDLEEPLSATFPEIKSTWNDPESIKVKHILSMCSGTQFGGPESQALLVSTCLEQLVLSSRRIEKPGTLYNYDNGLPALIATFLERKMGKSLESFAEDCLWSPLGIKDYRWTRMRQTSIDDSPMILTSGGLYMTLRDMVKVGQMMLRKGMFDGKRIVSEEWIRRCVEQSSPSGQWPYGYYWHLNKDSHFFAGFDDAYMALGQGEQVIVVIPSRNVVFAGLSSSWVPRGDGSKFHILQRFEHDILPIIK